MTLQSYKTTLEALKNNERLYEVIHEGEVFRFDDLVTASEKARETGGRLFRVVGDPEQPHGFLRKKIEPITLGYTQGQLFCIPVFGV